MNDKLNDGLDDLIGGATSEVRGPVNAPADYQPKGFVENCTKCGGSGYWRGRFKCFTCNGTGKVTFKTSFADRQKGRASAAKHKAKVAEGAWESFKAREPEVAAWIDRGESTFQNDMKAAILRYGDLTDNQLGACKRSAGALREAMKRNEERQAHAPKVEMAKIEEAFAAARASGLKNRKLRIGAYNLQDASAASANAGAIYVKSANGNYLGKIKDGRFMRSFTLRHDEQEKEIVELLADPKGSAIAYGKMMGACSCCGRPLTDPESVAAGIGPICASKWGF